MSAAGQCSIGLRTIRLGQGFREAGLLRPVTTEAVTTLRWQAMHTPPHLMLNLYAYVPLSNLSGWACYCDHQENRKSVIGREHLRVPSGVPLPASGLSAACRTSFVWYR